MNRQKGGKTAEFHHKITVSHPVHGILSDHRLIMSIYKAQLTGYKFAVQRQCAAGKGTTSQRADVNPHQAVKQSFVITLQHLHVGQKMMCQIHRLCSLQVGVARDEYLAVALAQLDQRVLQVMNLIGQLANFLTQPHAGVQCHLIVTRASCVQLGSRGHAFG